MSAFGFDDLKRHVGHKIVCVRYGNAQDVWNVAVECETCSEVLLDFDNPESISEDDSDA